MLRLVDSKVAKGKKVAYFRSECGMGNEGIRLFSTSIVDRRGKQRQKIVHDLLLPADDPNHVDIKVVRLANAQEAEQCTRDKDELKKFNETYRKPKGLPFRKPMSIKAARAKLFEGKVAGESKIMPGRDVKAHRDGSDVDAVRLTMDAVATNDADKLVALDERATSLNAVMEIQTELDELGLLLENIQVGNLTPSQIIKDYSLEAVQWEEEEVEEEEELVAARYFRRIFSCFRSSASERYLSRRPRNLCSFFDTLLMIIYSFLYLYIRPKMCKNFMIQILCKVISGDSQKVPFNPPGRSMIPRNQILGIMIYDSNGSWSLTLTDRGP